MLSMLVDQVLKHPAKKTIKIKVPRCPRCKSADRSLIKAGGRYADYCKNCTSVINKRRY